MDQRLQDPAVTDWRGLCEELLADYEQHLYRSVLADRARAALAQPETEAVRPTDEELLDEWNKAVINLPGDSWSSTGIAFARAVLARWGRPYPATAEGEVGELVAWLRANALTVQKASGNPANGAKQRMNRAAALLERQAAPVPVAVSERLPEAEDCDAEGRCWWWRTDDADEWWEFLCITDAREYNARCGSARYIYWLPFHALPLPAGEVK